VPARGQAPEPSEPAVGGLPEPDSWAKLRDGTAWAGMSSEPQVNGAAKRISPKRLLPLLVLLVGLGLFFVFDLGHYLSWDALAEYQDWLQGRIAQYGLLANLIFIAIYAVSTAFSVPGGSFLTIVGGFLFGTVAAAVSVVFGATIGAVCLFLAARYAFYDVLHAKAGPALLKMEQGFKKNALSYLLFLRLVPLFPFWLVNLVPALLDVPLKIYVIATFIGIIPGTYIYAGLGNGVGEIIAAGETPDLSIIYNPEVLLPLLGLAVLALVPVFYKAWKAHKDKNEDND
jgi:uncharacterized membrane protein YdjX (TVP38/TMEM64 family)